MPDGLAKGYAGSFVASFPGLNATWLILGLLEAVRRHGIPRFVFSSTCATYGMPETMPIVEETPQRPINPSGHGKLMIEQALADYAAAYPLGWANVAVSR